MPARSKRRWLWLLVPIVLLVAAMLAAARPGHGKTEYSASLNFLKGLEPVRKDHYFDPTASGRTEPPFKVIEETFLIRQGHEEVLKRAGTELVTRGATGQRPWGDGTKVYISVDIPHRLNHVVSISRQGEDTLVKVQQAMDVTWFDRTTHWFKALFSGSEK